MNVKGFRSEQAVRQWGPGGRVEARDEDSGGHGWGRDGAEKERERTPMAAVGTVVSSSGPRGGRGRVAASGGGVIVARDVGSKQEAAASPSAQTARASASLPRLGPC